MCDISVNNFSSTIVSKDGKVFNAGFINNQIQDYFKPLSFKEPIKETASTRDYLYVLTIGGTVFAYNWKTKEIRQILTNVKKIAGGKNHLLMLTNTNTVFGVGDNSYYQLVPQGFDYYEDPIEILANSPSFVTHNTMSCDNFQGTLTSDLLTNCTSCDNTCIPFTGTYTTTFDLIINPGTDASITYSNCLGSFHIAIDQIIVPVTIVLSYSGCCSLDFSPASNIVFTLTSATIEAGTYIDAVHGTTVGDNFDLTVSNNLDITSLATLTNGTSAITSCDQTFTPSITFNGTGATFTQNGNSVTLTVAANSTNLSVFQYSLNIGTNPSIPTQTDPLSIPESALALPCCSSGLQSSCQPINTTFSTLTTVPITNVTYSGLPAVIILPVVVSGLVIGECCGNGTGSISFKVTSMTINAGTYPNAGIFVSNFTVNVTGTLSLASLLQYPTVTFPNVSCDTEGRFSIPTPQVLFQCATFADSGSGITITAGGTSITITPTSPPFVIQVTSTTGNPVNLSDYGVNPTYFSPCCTPPVPLCTTPTYSTSTFTSVAKSINIGGDGVNNTLSYDGIPAYLYLPVIASGNVTVYCCINSAGVLNGYITFNVTSLTIPAGTYPSATYPTNGIKVGSNLYPVTLSQDIVLSTALITPIYYSQVLAYNTCAIYNPNLITLDVHLNSSLVTSNVNTSPLVISVTGVPYGTITPTTGTLVSTVSPPGILTEFFVAVRLINYITCCGLSGSGSRKAQPVNKISQPNAKIGTARIETIQPTQPVLPFWVDIAAGFNISILVDNLGNMWEFGSLYQLRARIQDKLPRTKSRRITILMNEIIPATITIYNKRSIYSTAKTLVTIPPPFDISYDCINYSFNNVKVPIDNIVVITTGATNCVNLNIFVDPEECYRTISFVTSIQYQCINVSFMTACCTSFTGFINYGPILSNRTITQLENVLSTTCESYIVNTYVDSGDVIQLLPENLTSFIQAITPDFPTVFEIFKPIRYIGVGYNNLSVITDREIFALGENRCGQLGLGDKTTLTCWRILTRNFEKVYSGLTSTFYLSREGKVYGTGHYKQPIGKCGCYDELLNSCVPVCIPGICGCIREIALGNEHILLLSDCNVYGFGKNEVGQLGFNKCRDATEFISLNYLQCCHKSCNC